MSDTATPQEAVKVEQDGVTVKKSCIKDEFPVPTVGFEITSNQDRDVTVRLVERVPDPYSMDAIGFHSDYESEHWTAFQDRQLQFERTIEPNERVLTIYGIRSDEEDIDLDAFGEPPELQVVRPTEAEDEPAPADDRQEDDVGDMMDHEMTDAEVIEEDDEAPPAGEDAKADVPEEESAQAPPAESEGDAEDADTGAEDLLVDQLLAELQDERVTDAERRAIREGLGIERNGRLEARLDHLQNRVEEAIAYADPVGEFLEDGGPEQLNDVRTDVEGLRDEVGQIRDLRPEMEERMQGVEASLGEVTETVEAVDDRLSTVLDDVQHTDELVEDLDAEMGTARTQLRELQSEITDLTTEIEEIQAWRNQLGELFGEAK